MIKPYYQDEAVTLYHGDCREILPQLTTPVDLVLTDPPFYLPAHIGTSRKVWPRSLSEVAIMEGYFRDAFGQFLGKLSLTGAAYIFCDSTSYAVFLSLLYPAFDRTQCIVWNKGKGGLGNGWRHSHELIIHGAFVGTEYEEGFRCDVIECAPVHSDTRKHQSEKPVSLMQQLMIAHPSDLVLDPFAGSGTTLRAAKDLGRKAIGVEIEEKYCEIAAKRMSQLVFNLE